MNPIMAADIRSFLINSADPVTYNGISVDVRLFSRGGMGGIILLI